MGMGRNNFLQKKNVDFIFVLFFGVSPNIFLARHKLFLVKELEFQYDLG
jgi:hypothetical protein